MFTPKPTPPELETPILAADPRIAAAAERYGAICSLGIALSNAERLIAAIDARNVAALGNLLHSGNRISRAVFEELTKTTLPSNQHLRIHLEHWAAQAQTVATTPNPSTATIPKPAPIIAASALEGYLESLPVHQRDKHKLALRKQLLHRSVIVTTAAFLEDLAANNFELQTHRLNATLEHHAVLGEHSYQLSAMTGAYLEYLRSQHR